MFQHISKLKSMEAQKKQKKLRKKKITHTTKAKQYIKTI